MAKHSFALLTLGLLAMLTNTLTAQHAQMPSGMTHEQHLAQMKKDAELKARGATAMCFDRDAVEHHFVLFENGGAIEVRAVRPDDSATRTAVRSHLQTIARDFAAGVFDKPFARTPKCLRVCRHCTSSEQR
jgi:hypothetical protein